MEQTHDRIIAYFRSLSNIPRASYNLDGVKLFLENFSKEHAFEYKRDTYGNCVIFVGDKTNITKKNVIIRSHMDMICVKSIQNMILLKIQLILFLKMIF